MSTATLEQSQSPPPADVGVGTPPPPAARPAPANDRVYRIIWRWHFYAGMIVAPALIVVAATGALYIFKDEIEALLHPGVTRVEPATERVSYEQQLAAARAAVPELPSVALMYVFANPQRATTFGMFGNRFQYSYVDPYTGRYLGGIPSGGFFDTVLNLHRTLFLGTTGRIIVELTTCWTIVLVATGAYLWWPRNWSQIWGVWLPRLRKKPYVILRDLHTLTGIYVAIVAIVISLTGLIYTYVWGQPYQTAARSEPNDMFAQPMQSKSAPDAKELPIDRFIELGHEKMPGKNLTIWFPRGENGVYLVFGRSEIGPSVQEMLFVDRATGEILDHRSISQAPPMYMLGSWNYTLHVGTILGMPSKIFWLVTCIILITSPLTGVWMWWERRPKGRLGLPRRIDARRPRWLVETVAATSILLPTLGISVLVVLILDVLVMRLRRASA